jgi:dihydrofolate reductase
MRVSIIVAMSRDYLIGREGGLPWHLPADLRRFRRITTGKPIIMGRKTLEAIGRLLPERTNIVLTRRAGYRYLGCQVAASIEVAFALAADDLKARGGDEVVVIGGAAVFREAMPFAERVYLTAVEGAFQGDVSFPHEWLHDGHWRVTTSEHHAADEKNVHAHWFVVLEPAEEGGQTIAEVVRSLSASNGR